MVKPKSALLERLSAQLKFITGHAQGFTQPQIAEKAGVSQTLVSRAMNGELVRETKAVRRLSTCVTVCDASMRKKLREMPRDVGTAVEGYLASGGDAQLLVKQVEILLLAVSGSRRGETPSRN